MVLFGGLTPITSRLGLDILSLVSLIFCAFSSTKNASNGLVLVGTCLVTLATAGMTCRWTLTFPMVPVVILQVLRRLNICSGYWTSLSITVLTTLLITVAALLSILFPALQLPPIEGEYNVGIVKLHLPVNFSTVYDQTDQSHYVLPDGFVSVRILYPTLDDPSSLLYLDKDIALDYCKETIAFGAPPPLKEFGFLLHNLRLAQMPLAPNAKPIDGKKLPLVVYSHGLGGTAITYTYQTQHLAAQGYVVLVLDHTDGSAPIVKTHDGTRKAYDTSVAKIRIDGSEVEYVRERRARTDHRVKEFLASALSLLNLNQRNIPELESVGVSFVNKLDTNDLHFMGHSFGGSTALTAASRRPDLASSVVAHEPAVDWMPDDARRVLFAEHRLVGGPRQYDGGTGGFIVEKEEEKKEADDSTCRRLGSLHDIPMLFLYSDEWREKAWGGVDLIEYMHQQGHLGPKLSQFGIIQDAHHMEFSDTCLLTPLWLARSVGATGQRDPRDTAEEIKYRTVDFINTVRSKK